MRFWRICVKRISSPVHTGPSVIRSSSPGFISSSNFQAMAFSLCAFIVGLFYGHGYGEDAVEAVLKRPDGCELFYIVDDFTDPWRPAETVLLVHGLAESTEARASRRREERRLDDAQA